MRSARVNRRPLAQGHLDARGVAKHSVDSYIEIDAEGRVTVFAGKVELGTGITTALAQIVAEELNVPFHHVSMILGDTGITPDQGTTAGSKTLQVAGSVLRQAAAAAYLVLLTRASEHLGVPTDELTGKDGVVCSEHGENQCVSYGELAGEPFEQEISVDALVKAPENHTVVGQSVPRVDILNKLTGGEAFIHDLRLEGMLHGRVVRPHLRTLDGVGGATVKEMDDSALDGMEGIVAVVQNGSFVGVVAEREEQAMRAADALNVTWSDRPKLPDHARELEQLRDKPAETTEPARNGDVEDALATAAFIHEARFNQSWQAHASMGPSCSVADVTEDSATVYSSSQNVYGLSTSIAPILGMEPEKVRVIFREGAGCYGHNGADDVSADAALLSQAVGAPVRVQWSLRDEFAWEPKGPAMTTDVRAGLDEDGHIIAWDYEVWTPPHGTRPSGEPSRLFAGQLVDPPFEQAPYRRVGGDRNASTIYSFPHYRIQAHWIGAPTLRQSSLRTLGGLHNATANEVFMDEMAVLAGADPVEFRLRHLVDSRALAVVEEVATAAGWGAKSSATLLGEDPSVHTGRGIAFVQYEAEFAYVGVVAEVAVNTKDGNIRVTRVIVSHDCGLIVNPDGVINQLEGNVIQGVSRALKEEVTWNQEQVTSLDWEGYEILGFEEVPEIETVLINRPDEPPLGAGEPAICPVIAAISNAVYDAVGARMRTYPFTPGRVLDVLQHA